MKNNNHLRPLYWWMGQIVDDKTWIGNVSTKKWMGTDELSGWGARYKIAIFGRDPIDKDVSDEYLDWAEVVYPVTAGTGNAGKIGRAHV